MAELRPDDALDPLVATLRASGPTGGLGVDFESVIAEVGRRQRRSRAVRAAGASVLTVAVIGVGLQAAGQLGFGGGGSSTTAGALEDAGSRTAQAGAAPAAAGAAAPTVANGADLAPSVSRQQGRSAGGCPVSVSPRSTAFTSSGSPMTTLLPDGVPTSVADALPQVHDQLVPATGAVSAVVCRYESAAAPSSQGPAAAVPLVAERAVPRGSDEVRRLAADLADLHGVQAEVTCPTPSGGSPSVLLVRVDYDAVPVWVVVTDDGCREQASNGLVTTTQPIAQALRRLIVTGVWRRP
jgi:hypothetical protein